MTGHQKNRPWRVVQQQSCSSDIEVCAHRWEWTAELHAGWRETSRGNRQEFGVFYTVQRRESAS